MSDEITPAIVAEYDQRVAKISETLDSFIDALKLTRKEFGGVSADIGLAQALSLVDVHWLNDMLTVAISRLASL